jgi:hypothetical protein
VSDPQLSISTATNRERDEETLVIKQEKRRVDEAGNDAEQEETDDQGRIVQQWI